MYYYSAVFMLFLSVFAPIGAIASAAEYVPYDNENIGNERYDFMKTQTFQVEGHSMESYGFYDRTLVDVVPASTFFVGDVIAFECTDEKCDGAYIKKITKKEGDCYWVEGRKDVWLENGDRRQSMDSRTTYDWLCGEEIKIYGVAFTKNV